LLSQARAAKYFEAGLAEQLQKMSQTELPNSPIDLPRILLVDDEVRNLDALESLLASPDYHIVRATTADEALMQVLNQDFATILMDVRITSQENVDLVISDIGLPDGDGYKLMSELKQNFGLKGIALSGYGTEEDIQRGKNAGFIAHLIKPVRIEDLTEVLRFIQEGDAADN
jgi:CheY-like chemotaxis protein